MLEGLKEYIDVVGSGARPPKSALTDLMAKRVRYLPRELVLQTCLRLVYDVPGCIAEFGVADGGSTRILRAASKKDIFAFDSFEGLRESYENLKVGTFAGPAPDIPGVNFVKGYFEDTCTEHLATELGRVAFASLDADLYSSTIFVLRWLTPLLAQGSLILFDEFVGEDGAEARAFREWQAETGVIAIRIAEFDRQPAGRGVIPDKRLLFQIVENGPEVQRPMSWLANSDTFLKATTDLASALPNEQKHQVRAGDKMTVDRREAHGAYSRVFGVHLNGRPLSDPWFILRAHWDLL